MIVGSFVSLTSIRSDYDLRLGKAKNYDRSRGRIGLGLKSKQHETQPDSDKRTERSIRFHCLSIDKQHNISP